MAHLRLLVNAGEHRRENCPVWVDIDPSRIDKGATTLADTQGRSVPCQWSADGTGNRLCFVLDNLAAGDIREFTLAPAASDRAAHGIELTDVSGDRVDVHMNGEFFTSYRYGAKWVRPFLLPIIGPYGAPITRGYPVEPQPGDKEDHPHHKSCWVAWGDVNGGDNWSEVEERHGRQVHQGFSELVSGPVFGRLAGCNHWVSRTGEKVLDEHRRMTFYNLPRSARIMDLDVTFVASAGPVTFGDTKEGGIASIRVATSMDAKEAGTIVNAYGGTNEAETWGKRAQWCDYSGPVQGRTVGIAILDSPGNFRYPTYWHVRDYGLMTANPFGLSHFLQDTTADGSHTLPKGALLPFRYRLYFHAGDARTAKVGDRFLDHVAPPVVEVL